MCYLWRRAGQQLGVPPREKAQDLPEASDETLGGGLETVDSRVALGAGAGERQDDPLAGVLNAALETEVRFIPQLRQPQEATLGIGQLIWEMFKEQGIQPVKEW